MTNLERIDHEIKELQRIRRMVVKGEKKFNKDEYLEMISFEKDLEKYDIPYKTFTYGNSKFYKIEDKQNDENIISENIENIED